MQNADGTISALKRLGVERWAQLRLVWPPENVRTTVRRKKSWPVICTLTTN